MKKILLLSTGGTIASTAGDKGLTPTLGAAALLELLPEAAAIGQLSYEELLSIDSSNMQPEDWQRMARAIAAALPHYDGIVLTHGTDTMAYSAAALSFMLRHLQKPVVLTGSQLPLTAEGSDGKDNILDALRVAASGLAGVYIVFDHQIIRGTCAKKIHSLDFSAFASINRPLAGRIEEGRVLLTASPAPVQEQALELAEELDTRVLVVKLTPGLEPALLGAAADLGYRAVVLEAFGLGGLPCQGRSLLQSISELLKRGITVVVSTQCLHGGCDMDVYDVGVAAQEAGALCGGDLTIETLLAKLMWLLGRYDSPEEVAKGFSLNLVGELDS